ncbi:MAG: VWA domain-containing protein [Phycisphaerales bacterium]|nr:VWA domain-containing protein [Phycisphaerales bacterium]
MTWLTPWTGLIVAASVVPPLLALYFLRLRRARRIVSSTMMWRRAVQDLRANAPFQRLRYSLLLLLQLLAVALIVLAIMQPQADIGETRGGRTVILIDNSASMNTLDVEGKSRLDAAKARALERLDGLFSGGWLSGPTAQVMVASFASGAQVIAPYTDSHAQAREAVESIEPTDEASNIGEAFELARAFSQAGDASSGRRQDQKLQPTPPIFEVYSDGRIADSSSQVLQPGERLIFHSIGATATPNLGIVVIGAERDPKNPEQIQVFARIANFAPQATAVDVQLSLDGAVRAVSPQPVPLEAAHEDPQTKNWIPGEAQVVFPAIALPAGGIASVSLATRDMFTTDDEARLVAPASKAMRILLVSDGGFLLKSLLEGMPIASLEVVNASEFEKLAEESGALDQFDVTVLDSVVLRALPPGRYLSLGPPPPLEGLNPYGETVGARLRGSNDEHPLLRFARMDDVAVGKLHSLAPSGQFEVVAESGSGPLVVALSKGSTRAVIVPFDPLDSNWPFLRGFVNFMANAIDWLGASGAASSGEAARPGAVLSTRLPSEASGLVMRLPNGKESGLSVADPSLITYGPVRHSGVYRLSWREGQRRDDRAFAVNVDTRSEGRVAALTDLVMQQTTVRGVGAAAALRTNLWPWALAAALLVLLAEWVVYYRRI